MLRSWLITAGIALAFVMGSPAQADTFPAIGLGMDVGGACLSTELSCSGAYTFGLPATVPVTGAFEYTPGGGGLGTMDINLAISDFALVGSGPDGVVELDFTNVSVSVNGWSTFDGGVTIDGLGDASLTLTGQVLQRDFFGDPVGSAQALNETLDASALVCGIVPNVTQCGFFLTARDFQIDVGDANALSHDIQLGFNVLVPEPSTALLLGLGLMGLGAARRA